MNADEERIAKALIGWTIDDVAWEHDRGIEGGFVLHLSCGERKVVVQIDFNELGMWLAHEEVV